MRHDRSLLFGLPRVLAAVMFFTCLANNNLQAQFPDPFASTGRDLVVVRGVVQTDEAIGAGLVVQLQALTGSQFGYKSDVSPDGSFAFPGVPSGQYNLSVNNMYGRSICTQFVSVDQNMIPLTVRLPKNKMERPISGTVSVARLEHKVPRKARKEFRRAGKALRKGNEQKCIEHLQKAVAIDPEYVEAHNNLGARYLHIGQAEKALAEFRAALKLDAHAPVPQVNVAAALFTMKNFPDAETAARAALELNPLMTRARYILGLSLMEQHKFTPEALDNLQRASKEIPQARLAAAQLFEITGQATEARNQLQAYLSNGKGEQNSDQVKAWLASLTPAQR